MIVWFNKFSLHFHTLTVDRSTDCLSLYSYIVVSLGELLVYVVEVGLDNRFSLPYRASHPAHYSMQQCLKFYAFNKLSTTAWARGSRIIPTACKAADKWHSINSPLSESRNAVQPEMAVCCSEPEHVSPSEHSQHHRPERRLPSSEL